MSVSKSILLVVITTLLAIGLPGCEPYQPPPAVDRMEAKAFREEKVGTVLHISVDFSGSFLDLMTRDGRAYQYVLRLLQDCFQREDDQSNRLLITQISATPNSIVFYGTPQSFKQTFPSAEAFRQHILRNTNPGGSRVYDSIADGIEFAVKQPGVTRGQTVHVLVVFSDMLDNAVASPQRLVGDLRLLAEHRGIIGMYFVNNNHVAYWENTLQQCGFPRSRARVYPTFSAETPLPNY